MKIRPVELKVQFRLADNICSVLRTVKLVRSVRRCLTYKNPIPPNQSMFFPKGSPNTALILN